MNRLVFLIALSMSFSTAMLLTAVLQQEGIRRKDKIELDRIVGKEAICQEKMDSLGLLMEKERI